MVQKLAPLTPSGSGEIKDCQVALPAVSEPHAAGRVTDLGVLREDAVIDRGGDVFALRIWASQPGETFAAKGKPGGFAIRLAMTAVDYAHFPSL